MVVVEAVHPPRLQIHQGVSLGLKRVLLHVAEQVVLERLVVAVAAVEAVQSCLVAA